MRVTERTRDFGHYGCAHVGQAAMIWRRQGRAWCTACYTMRYGIHPVLDPYLERDGSA